MTPLAVLASGMLTGVGLSAPATCAAIRAAIDQFTETRFIDDGGQWILGCRVPLDPPLSGRRLLVHLATSAIRECLPEITPSEAKAIPLFLCVAERERPVRAEGLDEHLLREVQEELGVNFHPRSTVVPHGRVAVARALQLARRLIASGEASFCLVAGTDSLIVGGTIAAYEKRRRILTSKNSDGFIPGEAGAAVMIGEADPGSRDRQLLCLGVGESREQATVESGKPLRADGLVAAIKTALAEAKLALHDLDYRLTDLGGEQRGFKEAALALTRIYRGPAARFPIWHPADCIGEVGAAVGPCLLALALGAARKGYAPGPGVVCHLGNDDDGARAAIVLRSSANGSA